MTPADATLIKVLFDDSCHGCVNSWLIPNFGWILFFIIFILPFLAYGIMCLIGDFFCKIFGIPQAPVFERRGGGVHKIRHGVCPWKHGDKVSQSSLQDILDGKPGREGYWDSYKDTVVFDLKDLTPIPTTPLVKI